MRSEASTTGSATSIKWQERGGITTPNDCPFVFLFTGESGEQFGYSDGWRPDGIFAYTGEGQSGDMSFVRGNRAIRDHLADGRDLLLFEATRSKGNYRYIGCFAFAGCPHVTSQIWDPYRKVLVMFLRDLFTSIKKLGGGTAPFDSNAGPTGRVS
ncbi:hypothetical protein [Bradyrhizobium genosp. SA-3]|uniref:hypothetical protein n=1 Tax=Bradyrhizobium genosp. SA-3 TaxID=508868 RepID=UPI0013EE50FF|nr:hypothetical protein [Bradyrhizobium genosp. SA-3]